MHKTVANLLMIALLGAAATAQTKSSTPVKPAVKPSTATAAPAKPSPKAAAPATTPTAKPVAKVATPAAKPAAKTATAMPKAAAPKAVAKPSAKKPVVAKNDNAKAAPRGKRDPFISPVRMQEERQKLNPACAGAGAKCLIISQIVLKGVVKTPGGMIAMVENAARKQYNLHEKDTVQSGVVVKITSDSIVFRETITDMMGNSQTKEVVKRVTVPVV